MSNRETSPEIASMAGRILSAGNPLDNEQVILAIYDALPPGERMTTARIKKDLSTVLQPYFDNMLSLAGSCLSQAEPDDGDAVSIIVPATVGWDKIANQIVGALEGGSGDWLTSYVYLSRPDDGKYENPIYSDPKFWGEGGRMKFTYDHPDEEGENSLEVGIGEIKKGLRLMAEKSPKHFMDIMHENDDAITSDVFMQYVILGEIVYG